MKQSFGARSPLQVGNRDYQIYRLDAVSDGDVAGLPYSLKILLENLLRHEDGVNVTRDDILALAHWDPGQDPGNGECGPNGASRQHPAAAAERRTRADGPGITTRLRVGQGRQPDERRHRGHRGGRDHG